MRIIPTWKRKTAKSSASRLDWIRDKCQTGSLMWENGYGNHWRKRTKTKVSTSSLNLNISNNYFVRCERHHAESQIEIGGWSAATVALSLLFIGRLFHKRVDEGSKQAQSPGHQEKIIALIVTDGWNDRRDDPKPTQAPAADESDWSTFNCRSARLQHP